MGGNVVLQAKQGADRTTTEELFSTGNALWLTNRDIFAALTMETRMVGINTVGSTDFAQMFAATPTAADGSELITWTGFTNTPKFLRVYQSYPNASSTVQSGWICTVNAANDTAAATAINTAINSTGLSVVTTTPVDADTDHSSVFYIPFSLGLFERAFSSEITRLDFTACAIAGTPYNADVLAEFQFITIPS